MKKVIFWDFDGTLVYSNSSFKDSLNEALQTYGYKIDTEVIFVFLKKVCSWYHPERVYVGNTGERWWQELLKEVAIFCDQHEVESADAEKVCKLFRQKVIEFPYRIYEDAEEILSCCCKNGYRNYIISNNFPELTDVVKRYCLEKYFDGYILSTDVGYEKPKEEIFRIALEVAGNPKPEECYMIGDNPVADIQGANSVGMKTIWVHGKDEQMTMSTFACENLRNIKKVI